MILGAGPLQVSAIRKAVELDLEVITVDYLPENMGHRYSHHFVNCSTTDREGVLYAAREMEIDGICTFSSDAVHLFLVAIYRGYFKVSTARENFEG